MRRLAIACEEGKEHTELFVNYRRDGTPFLNLLMIVPLLDTRGNVRYFLGAQVDVSGLLKDMNSLESVRRLLTGQKPEDSCKPTTSDRLQAMKSLSLMLGGDELDIVRRHGGYLSQGYSHLHDTTTASLEKRRRTRILLQGNDEDFADDLESDDDPKEDHSPLTAHELLNKRFVGVYQNVSDTTHTENFCLLIRATVSRRSTSSLLTYPIRFSIASHTRPASVASDTSHRRQLQDQSRFRAIASKGYCSNC